MKRFIKRSVAAVLCTAMVVTLAPSSPASAAKKVKLSAKTVKVEVGKTKTVKVKNATKKSKFTWKIKKASIAKIKSKKGKGKKAKAVILGVKAGTTKLTATYKVGKKKKTLSCKIKVNDGGVVAPSAAPSAGQTAAPSPAGSKPPVTTQPPVETTKPTRTPRVTSTPSPTPTPKPAAEVKPTDIYVDILNTTTVVFNPTREEDKAKVEDPRFYTKNDDGTITLDFLDTVYCGARFTFEKPLNLEDYAYLVVDGIDAPGVTDEGHQLAAQFLDAIDHNESHGGLLEIDTVDSIKFPIIISLTDKTKRTNVNSFEIYTTDGDKPKGPITIKSIKLYKSEEDYQKDLKGELVPSTPEPSDDPGVTPEPSDDPGVTPEPSDDPGVTPEPVAQVIDVAADTVTIVGQDASKPVKGEDGSLSYENEAGFSGFMIPIPEEYKVANGESLEVSVEYESTGCDARAYLIVGTIDSAKSNIVGPVAEKIEGVMEATDNCDTIFIKAATWQDKFTTLKVKSIALKKIMPEPSAEPSAEPSDDPDVTPTPIPAPKKLDLSTINIADGSTMTTLEDGSVEIACNGQYTGGITIAIPEDAAEGVKVVAINVDSYKENEAGERENVGGGQFALKDANDAELALTYNWGADVYWDTELKPDYTKGGAPAKLILNNQEAGTIFVISSIELRYE